MTDRPAVEGGAPVRPGNRFLVFGSPDLHEEELRDVEDCLRSRWIGTGPKVTLFEQQFARYQGGAHAVAVSSCTAAMHLAMIAIGVGSGDEVITTPMTFCATINAIIHTGARPVLADCDPRTMNIDPGSIAARITPRTKAIIVVHFAGRSCDMDAILEIAGEHGLRVVEDCAHAIETRHHGRSAGTMGDVGCFSFYVTKNVTTGEGGMLVTADTALADTVRIYALHGLSKDAWKRYSDEGYQHYQVVLPGYKYNMMDLQAVIGLRQLERVDENWRRRADIWSRYDRAFADLPCTLPAAAEPGTRHAYHLYTPLLDLERLRIGRDEFLGALSAENIGAGVHYVPVHCHPYYHDAYGWSRGEYPGAEHVGDRTVSLPLGPGLGDEDVDDVCRAVRRILEFYAA